MKYPPDGLPGRIRQCAKETCPFQIMWTEGGWYHVDTHGKDTSDHKAEPKAPDEIT